MTAHEGRSAAASGSGASHDAPQLFSHLLASKPERSRKGTAWATLFSVASHAAVLALLIWATMAVGKEVVEEEEVTLIELPPEEFEPPPPPPPPDNPAPAVEEVRGFQTLTIPEFVPPEIPPPATGIEITEQDFSGEGVEGGRGEGREVTGEDIYAAPSFTPYSVAPELKNRQEIARQLARFYPPLLRDAGIGGTVNIWILIDETGKVLKTQVQKSGGHKDLDEAALRVAALMEFSPAMNRDQKVKVWVALPIQFEAR